MNADKIKTLRDNIKNIFKKDFVIGLDIGTSSVKIAQFTKKEDGLHLAKADLKEIKPLEDKALRENEIISALKGLLRGIDVKKSKFIASIDCPKTAVKRVVVPYMPKGELSNALRLEVKSYFPFPVDAANLDFEILGDIVEKGVRKYEVEIAVSPPGTVNAYLSLLGKVGIKPASFIPCPYALQKIAENLRIEKEKAACFIDIGERNTELVILKNRTLMFARKIPVTGSDFTNAMTGSLVSERGKTELTLAEAEAIKRETGIPPEGEQKIIADKISAAQILSMIRTPLEQLVNEIERCFDYYREESGGGKIDSVALFGGGAALGGITKFLSEELGLEIRLGDPTEGLNARDGAIADKDRISYRLAPAIGAALTEARGINLLPEEIKEEAKKLVQRGTIEAVVTTVVLLSLLFYMGMRIQLGIFKKRIAVAKMELASLAGQYKNAEAYHLANMVLVDEPHWEDIFRELGNVIPDEIHIRDLKMQDGIIIIEGIAATSDDDQVISKFIFNLENGIFKNVKLVKTADLKDQTGGEFVIRCRAE